MNVKKVPHMIVNRTSFKERNLQLELFSEIRTLIFSTSFKTVLLGALLFVVSSLNQVKAHDFSLVIQRE